MIRPLLLLAAAALLVGIIGCGDPENANPKVAPNSKTDPALQPAGRGDGGPTMPTMPTGAAAQPTGAKPTAAVNQP